MTDPFAAPSSGVLPGTSPQRLRVAYVHGRPCSHPNQQLSAQSVGGEFIPADFRLRWQDRSLPRYRRYLSWLVCALDFPRVSEFDMFLAGGAHAMLPLMRKLGRLRREQKLVLHFGDEMLSSLRAGWFSPFRTRSNLEVIASYDALLCEGTMQAEFARELLGHRCPPVHVVLNGVQSSMLQKLSGIEPDLGSPRLLHIGAVNSDLRLRYKGLDTMLEAFGIAHSRDTELQMTIVGTEFNDVVRPYFDRLAPAARRAVTFVGYTAELDGYLAGSSLYVHCANGDAFPTTVLMAMAAGVPALVSETTGARDAVREADPRFVVPQEPRRIADEILAYRSLPAEEKAIVGAKMREVVQRFSEEEQIARYRAVFNQMIRDFGLARTLVPLEEAMRQRIVLRS